MSATRVAIALTLAAVAATALPAQAGETAQAAKRRSCGKIESSSIYLRSRPRALEAIGKDRRVTAHAAACGTVSYGGRTYVLFYKGMRCAKARKRVRHVHEHKRLRGWSCSSGSNFHTGGVCRRGKRHFGWHPGD